MVLPEMVERKDGVVLVVSSVGGLRASQVIGTYNISKAADLALVRNLSAEYGRHNIRVNAIAPGFILTEMSKTIPEEHREAMLQQIPLGRHGEPDQIADVVLFLASDLARYVSGQTLHVNGGWYA